MISNFIFRNKHSFATGYWFLHDFVLRFKYKIALITCFGAAATAIQAGILAFLSRYIANDLQAHNVEFLNYQHANLILAAFIFITLGASVLLMYLNGRETLRLWPVYQLHLVNRMLSALNQAANRGVVNSIDIKETIVPKVLISSQRMGACTLLVTKSILPIIQFIGFTAVAFSIDPLMSSVVFILVTPVSAVILLYFSRKASQCDRMAESMARESNKEMLGLIDANLNDQHHSHLIDYQSKESEFLIEKRIEMVVKRLEWAERARLTMGVITVGLLGGLFAFSSKGVDVKWGELIVYLIALMLAFRQLASLALTVSNFGRFYPTISRYMNLLDIVSTSSSPEEFKLRIEKGKLKFVGGNDL